MENTLPLRYWGVDYSIHSDVGECSLVGSGSIEVEAPDYNEAERIVRKHVYAHDLRADERINPIVTVTNVCPIDPPEGAGEFWLVQVDSDDYEVLP